MAKSFNYYGHYTCDCGKEFNNSQSYNGHKAHCVEHLKNTGKLEQRIKLQSLFVDIGHKAKIEKLKNEKQNNLDIWIKEEHKCECCGKVMTEYYGSGRFCSRHCSSVRTHKRNINVNGIIDSNRKKHIKFVNEYNKNPNKCVICGNVIPFEKRKNKTCCNECKNELIKNKKQHKDKSIKGLPINGRHIVYKTTCLLDDTFYIGVRKTNDDSKDKYLGSGVIIKNKIKKYGKENFVRETLFEFDNSKDAFDKEYELLTIDGLIKDKLCLNLASGGQGGCTKIKK